MSEPNCVRCGHAAIKHREAKAFPCAGRKGFCRCVGYLVSWAVR